MKLPADAIGDPNRQQAQERLGETHDAERAAAGDGHDRREPQRIKRGAVGAGPTVEKEAAAGREIARQFVILHVVAAGRERRMRVVAGGSQSQSAAEDQGRRQNSPPHHQVI
jgi:hypothetical protein